MAGEGSHLLNPSSFDRRDVVELTLPLEGGPHAGVQVLEEHPATEVLHRTGSADAPLVVAREMLMEQTDTVAARLVEEDGVLQVHLLAARDPEALDLDDALGELGQRCAAEPDLVVETVLHRAVPTRRVLALSETVAGYGWAQAVPVAPTAPVVAFGTHGLSNGLVRLEVEAVDGTWAVDGLAGMGRLVDSGDVGDTYNWCPPDVDTVVDRPASVTVQRTADGPVRGTLVIDAEYLLPEREGADDEGRSIRAGEVRQSVRTTLELRADEPFVRVTVELDQRARDHRLRAVLPLPRRTDHSVAECAYAHVRRPLHAEGGPGEWGVPTYPSRRHVRAGGLLVAHEGLCEYELVDLDGDAASDTTTAGALALTLVRSTGWLSRGPMTSRPLPAGPEDRLEGAQTLKPLVLRYVVAVDPDDELDPEQTCDRAFSPLVVVEAAGGGDLASHGAWLTVRGATVDALLPDDRADAPPGGVTLRVHESTGSAGELVIEGRTGTLVDLTGTGVAPFDGRLPLRPHQIVTVRLDPPAT
jgi:hypothetical protein